GRLSGSARGGVRAGERGAGHHRRPRELRADARPGDGPAAHGAHDEPGADPPGAPGLRGGEAARRRDPGGRGADALEDHGAAPAEGDGPERPAGVSGCRAHGDDAVPEASVLHFEPRRGTPASAHSPKRVKSSVLLKNSRAKTCATPTGWTSRTMESVRTT